MGLLLQIGLKLLLHRRKLRLSLIAGLCGFVQSRAGCSVLRLQVAQRAGCFFLVGELGLEAILDGAERQDLAPSTVLIISGVQHRINVQPPSEQGQNG